MGKVTEVKRVVAKEPAEKLARKRLSVLELAERLGNVSEACRSWASPNLGWIGLRFTSGRGGFSSPCPYPFRPLVFFLSMPRAGRGEFSPKLFEP